MTNKANSTDAPANNDMLQQTQRLLAWSAYHESLKEIDQKAVQQFHLTVTNLRAALWFRVGIYILQFIVVASALFVGLFQITKTPSGNSFGVVLTLTSLLLLAILLFRNPIQSMNRVLVDLARVQIILQGYTRQINQIDTVFKQTFLEKKIETKSLKKSLEQIQKVIDGNIESLLQFLEEMQF